VKTLIIKTPGYVWENLLNGIMVDSAEEASMYLDFEARAKIFKRRMYHITAHWGIDFQMQEDPGMSTRSHGVGALLDCSHDSESFPGSRPPASVRVPSRSSALFKKLGFRRR